MKKSELIVRISSKLIFVRWVGYLDRAYYGFMRSRQECCRLLKIWASSQIGPFHKKQKNSPSYVTRNGAISSQIFLNYSLTRDLDHSELQNEGYLKAASRGSNLINIPVAVFYAIRTINIIQL